MRTSVVFVGAVQLFALPKLQQIPANGHLFHIVLMQETALVAFHAHTPKPVCAYRLQQEVEVQGTCLHHTSKPVLWSIMSLLSLLHT